MRVPSSALRKWLLGIPDALEALDALSLTLSCTPRASQASASPRPSPAAAEDWVASRWVVSYQNLNPKGMVAFDDDDGWLAGYDDEGYDDGGVAARERLLRAGASSGRCSPLTGWLD